MQLKTLREELDRIVDNKIRDGDYGVYDFIAMGTLRVDHKEFEKLSEYKSVKIIPKEAIEFFNIKHVITYRMITFLLY